MTELIRMLDLLLISQPEFLQIQPISDVDVKGGIRDVAHSSLQPQKPRFWTPKIGGWGWCFSFSIGVFSGSCR